VKSPPRPGHISEFEQGKREPSLPVLLRYARVAGLQVDALIDDEIDLPDQLPVTAEAEESKLERKSKAGGRRAR
jgi:transcriptional regulator with XRE-family HTH domain